MEILIALHCINCGYWICYPPVSTEPQDARVGTRVRNACTVVFINCTLMSHKSMEFYYAQLLATTIACVHEYCKIC